MTLLKHSCGYMYDVNPNAPGGWPISDPSATPPAPLRACPRCGQAFTSESVLADMQAQEPPWEIQQADLTVQVRALTRALADIRQLAEQRTLQPWRQLRLIAQAAAAACAPGFGQNQPPRYTTNPDAQ